ncbi:FtsW/RodA/SpoVE family cell cycle protein, partial [Candidatus Curtissbacteria bacterium]|nr:FtsW/RodA/SpoVE family cell cycle protein [Candidatus Curtissbacteria bacterium]
TLPLVSYGGSSLISILFLLGVVFSVKRYQY